MYLYVHRNHTRMWTRNTEHTEQPLTENNPIPIGTGTIQCTILYSPKRSQCHLTVRMNKPPGRVTTWATPPNIRKKPDTKVHTAHNSIYIKNVQQAKPSDATRGRRGVAWGGAGVVETRTGTGAPRGWLWFAFLRWSAMSSMFSLAYWVSVCLLCKNVCLGLLPIFLIWLFIDIELYKLFLSFGY